MTYKIRIKKSKRKLRKNKTQGKAKFTSDLVHKKKKP